MADDDDDTAQPFKCPRCGELRDDAEQPDGCRDWNCPKGDGLQ